MSAFRIAARGIAMALSMHVAHAAANWLPDRSRIDDLLASLGGADRDDADDAVGWGLLPGPFYTPETSFGVGVALVGLYHTDAQQTLQPLSSLTLSGFASITGTFGFDLNSYNYFNDDQQRVFVFGSLVNQPTRYWGIGHRAGRDDHPQEYTAQSVELWPQFYQRIAATIWAGVGWRVSQLHAGALEDDPSDAIADTADGPSVLSSGASVHILNDTRDFAPNPSRGHVLSIDYTAYRPGFGSDRTFDALTTRVGAYLGISPKTTLAFDLYGDFRSGSAPWNELPSLGGSQRMRGYYDGRYRDRDTISTQIEWRHQLEWRHGIVLWAGAGSLAARPSDLGTHVLPSFGTGYRFMFKPRVNVRLDLGVGHNSAGVYFQVGEAY